jgi:glycosyltransferase involved in cell wall biosynthesis
MIIWIVTTGEQLPDIDGENIRLWRSVMLSQALVKLGHSVVRWTSTFDHSSKKHRFGNNTEISMDSQYKIKFIKSKGYKKNISLQRLKDHYYLAKEFSSIAIKESVKPDLILCSLPTLSLSVETTKFGIEHNIPVILDGRDMWPNLFIDFFPNILKPIASLFLYPMFNSLRFACKNAYALSGISGTYVDWEIKHSGRSRTDKDRDFPHGYSSLIPSEDEIINGAKFWREKGLKKDSDFLICLFSAIGHMIDMDTIIKAAKILISQKSNIKFVFCGNGDKLSEFKQKSKDLSNIIFVGWIDSSLIWSLMQISKLGILPYYNIDNYKFNLPNKPIEYLSAGLPIVSGVKGLTEELIGKYDCGVVYNSAEDLVEKLLELNRNSERLNQMSINALNLFRERFTSEIVYNNMANYLIELSTSYKRNE